MASRQQKNTSKNFQLVVRSKVQSDLEPSCTSRRSPAPVQSWCEVTQAHYLSSAPGLGRQKIKLVWYLCIPYKRPEYFVKNRAQKSWVRIIFKHTLSIDIASPRLQKPGVLSHKHLTCSGAMSTSQSLVLTC